MQTRLKTLTFPAAHLGVPNDPYNKKRLVPYSVKSGWSLQHNVLREEEIERLHITIGLLLRMLRTQLHLNTSLIRSTSGEAWET